MDQERKGTMIEKENSAAAEKREKRTKILIRICMVVLLFCIIAAFTPLMQGKGNAASAKTDSLGYSLPKSVYAKAGETKTVYLTAPSWELSNVSWGYNGYYCGDYCKITNVSCSYGSYGGRPAFITFNCPKAGETKINAEINRIDKTSKKTIGKLHLSVMVYVEPAGSSSTSSTKDVEKHDRKPAVRSGNKIRKNKSGYRSVGKAYRYLNDFRTSKTWQWNKGNRSKTWFNTTGKNRLKPLKRNKKLEAVAKVRAKESSVRFDKNHTRPNGTPWNTVYPKKKIIGENAAIGYTGAKTVTIAWKETNEKYEGQGHRRNMLNKNFNSVGIACYEKNGVKYWVQAFGKM